MNLLHDATSGLIRRSATNSFLMMIAVIVFAFFSGEFVNGQCTSGCETSGTIFDTSAGANQSFSGIGGPHAQMFQTTGGCATGGCSTSGGPVWNGRFRNAPIISGDCYGGGQLPSSQRPHVGNRIGIGNGIKGARPDGLFGSDWTRTVTGFGGWNRIADFLQEDTNTDVFDDDFAVGLAIGRRHNSHFRSEFEFAYRSNDEQLPVDFGVGLPVPPLLGESADVYSIMKNFFIDFGNEYSRFRPYVGIGLGYSFLDTDFFPGSGLELDSESAFAWQPIGGVSMQLGAITHAFVEYRYFNTAEFDIIESGVDNGLSGNYGAHNLFVGLRFEW